MQGFCVDLWACHPQGCWVRGWLSTGGVGPLVAWESEGVACKDNNASSTDGSPS